MPKKCRNFWHFDQKEQNLLSLTRLCTANCCLAFDESWYVNMLWWHDGTTEPCNFKGIDDQQSVLSVHFVSIKKWKWPFSLIFLRVGGFNRITCLFGKMSTIIRLFSFDMSSHHVFVLPPPPPPAFRYLLAVLCLWPVCCASFPLKSSTYVSFQNFSGTRAFTARYAQPGVTFFSSSQTFLTKEGGCRVSRSLHTTFKLHTWECSRHQPSRETKDGWPHLCEGPWKHAG